MVTVEWKAPLIGRGEPLRTLRQALGRARTGLPQLVVVAGEPGLGKSRLVGEFAAGADDAVRVLQSHCLELSGSVLPLAPIQGLVHRACRRLGVDVVRQAAGPYLPMLAVLEPALSAGGEATNTSGVADQRALFAGVRHLLEQLSDAGPLLVVVEDLHWADESTVDVLTYLATSLEDAAVLLVTTVRSGPPADRLRSALARSADATFISLHELSPEDATRLAGELGGHAPQDLAAASPLDIGRLVERSGGNPLYLEELVEAIDSEDLPDSLRALLLARLDSLGDDARRLVDLVALGDPPVRHEDLVSSTGWAEAQVDTAIAHARAGGVMSQSSVGHVTLRHPLLGDAARSALPPGLRRALHRSWAAALNQRRTATEPQAALAVAYHWAQAAEPDHALQVAWAGAQASTALQTPATRAALLDRVSDVWSQADTTGIPSDLVDVLVESARSHELASAYDHAVARLERALTLVDAAKDPGRAAMLLVARGRVEWSWRDTSPEPSFRRALALLPATRHDDMRARVLAEWADYQTNVLQMDGLSELADEAVRLANASGDAAIEGKALRCLAHVEWLADPAKAAERQRRAIALAAQAGDYDVMLSAMGNLANTRAWFLGERDEALIELQEFWQIARRVGMHAHIQAAGLLIVTGQLQRDAGDLDGANSSAMRAQRMLGEHGYSNFCRAIRADVALIRGDIDGARGLLDDMVRSPHDYLDIAGLDSRAWLAWHDQGPAAAGDVLLPGLLSAIRGGNDLALIGLTDHVLPLARYLRLSQPVPDVDSPLAWALDAIRRRYREVVPHDPIVAALTATLAPLDSADPASGWRAAVRAYEQHPGLTGLYWHIDHLIRLAETTASRAEAHDALGVANRLAGQLGSQPQQDEIAGLRGRLARQPGPAGLTPREIEILELVAQGLTNSQIAEHLFITRSTAGVHISHILTKTDTHDRHDAVRWAREHGLVLSGEARRA